MKIYWAVLLTAWTTAWVGFAIGKVGESFEGGTYTLSLVIEMTLVCLMPALLGYLLGCSSIKEKS
jgi:hypothetical protein